MDTSKKTSSGASYTMLPTVSVSNTRRWVVMWLLFIASVINYLDRATISFALPVISHDLHMGPESMGVLLSAFFWSYTLMQIPIGKMADRLNLLWGYAGAFALWSLAQGRTGLAGSLMCLILLRIVLGIGEAIYLPGGTKIVSLLFAPSERGTPSGFFDSGTRFGLVLGGIGIPWLLVRYGWRDTFVFVGILGLLWLVPWLTAFPSKLAHLNEVQPSPPVSAAAPTASERWRCSVNDVVRMLRLAGERTAAPSPWRARAPTIMAWSRDPAPTRLAAVKTAMPTRKVRRRPAMSPIRPPRRRKPPMVKM